MIGRPARKSITAGGIDSYSFFLSWESKGTCSVHGVFKNIPTHSRMDAYMHGKNGSFEKETS